MESVSAGGALGIACAAVLAGLSVTGAFVARHHGRDVREWTLALPAAVVLFASSFLVLRLIMSIEPGQEQASETDAPQVLPDWVFADSTALVAAITMGIGAVALVICFLVRVVVNRRLNDEVDAAMWKQPQGEHDDGRSSNSE